MKELQDRILSEGKIIGDGILKVDSLINHQMDPGLMFRMGEEIARQFADRGVTRILTSEVSGIGPALTTGYALGVPVVYARKRRPVTMTQPVYVESAPSHTKGGEVLLMVAPEFLHPDDRVLIIDDFLATGLTIHALARLVAQSGATLVGIATLIEKTFQGGRDILADLAVPVVSLAVITGMEDGRVIFAGEE